MKTANAKDLPETAAQPADVTSLLLAWSDGDETALERLIPRVYRELRRVAAGCMRQERGDHTLQATALVHETYLRLIDQQRARWQDRAQFFAVAARLMRRILVDHARRAGAVRRGDGRRALPLTEAESLAVDITPDVLAVDQALRALAAVDAEKSRLVELRFFAGLANEEIAQVLGISEATVARRWRVARAWLHRHLSREGRL